MASQQSTALASSYSGGELSVKERENQALLADLEPVLGDWHSRINSLYKITTRTPEGADDVVTFKLNWAQQNIVEHMWHQNIVLKARQFGITTFVMIFMLDQCLFNPNTHCGVIAHGKEEAGKLFREKILFAYEHLDPFIKAMFPVKYQTKTEIVFENGSSITVGTSLRSGTYQVVHVSEFGKICAKYPDRAREVVTGTLEAIGVGNVVFIESTAEGTEGYFYDWCQTALNAQRAGKRLSMLDYRMHFLPWWKHADNVLDDPGVPITSRMLEYFLDLEQKLGIKLSRAQKAWYQKKESVLGDDIKREHPSTPEEAFEVSIEGAYYAKEFIFLYSNHRICEVPVQVGVPVDTWWDIGVDDYTAIWFTQTIGREIHVIDYYENEGEGLVHYIEYLKKKEYHYGKHWGPHDINVREWGQTIDSEGGKPVSRLETARRLGIRFATAANLPRAEGIELVRRALKICWFDEGRCELGLRRLENYRKKWDDRLGRWKSEPLKDENTDGADAFRMLAVSHPLIHGAKRSGRKQVETRKRTR